jgi:hypothetical protein
MNARVEGEWTLALVERRFQEAIEVLRRLPNIERPGRLRSFYPTVVREREESYGWSAAEARPAVPTPAEISRMDECVDWLAWLRPAVEANELPEDMHRIVWARAAGFPWPAIRRHRRLKGRGNSARTLRRHYVLALEIIRTALNAERRVVRRPAA